MCGLTTTTTIPTQHAIIILDVVLKKDLKRRRPRTCPVCEYPNMIHVWNVIISFLRLDVVSWVVYQVVIAIFFVSGGRWCELQAWVQPQVIEDNDSFRLCRLFGSIDALRGIVLFL